MGDIPSLPTEIINKVINLGGVERKLRCKNCLEYTNHVSISFSQRNPFDEDEIGRLLGRIVDILPGLPILFGNPFACTKCGSIRNEGGIFNIHE